MTKLAAAGAQSVTTLPRIPVQFLFLRQKSVFLKHLGRDGGTDKLEEVEEEDTADSCRRVVGGVKHHAVKMSPHC